MNNKIKALTVFYALCAFMADVIDELNGTTMFNRKMRKHARQLMTWCEDYVDKLHGNLDSEGSDYFLKSQRLIEVFMLAIKNGNIDVLILVLNEFQKGEITVVDETKHGKFLSQQKKISVND